MRKRGTSGRKRVRRADVARLRALVLRGVGIAGLGLSQMLGLVCMAGAQAPQAGGARAVVVLDAAHGGTDGGATLLAAEGYGLDGQGSVSEKTVTLALVQQLRSLLGARGFAVVMTRTGDAAVDADARATTANHAGAMACLSLHATETGSGVHLFVSSVGATSGALLMPWKTAQSAYVTRSLKLASELNDALAGSGNADDAGGAIPVTLGRTTLPGIDSMTCPAIAVELAPLLDAKGKIVSEVTASDYQRRVVGALAAGLLAWRGDSESGGGNPR
uniref:MurNAc-LAA domain-containing protein n=1 Tax=mine drainage metagenome TaxID=410659 RepID=E6QLG2_9ZZZZ